MTVYIIRSIKASRASLENAIRFLARVSFLEIAIEIEDHSLSSPSRGASVNSVLVPRPIAECDEIFFLLLIVRNYREPCH